MSAEHPLTPGEYSNRLEKMEHIIAAVRAELTLAILNHGDFASAHEGYAVIREELELELWPEVGKKRAVRSRAVLEKEAIQVAAMAIKFALNVDRMVG